MKISKIDRISLFILLVFMSSPSHSVSYQEACYQSQRGWTKLVQRKLNEARDSLADRARDLNWKNYCDCYAPAMEALGKDLKAAQKETEISLRCARKAGVVQAAPKPKAPLATVEFFNLAEKTCKDNSTGQIILIESQLKSISDPRADRVRQMDLPRYCSCYFANIRRSVGDALAQRGYELAPKPPLGTEEMMKYSEASDLAKEDCAREQLPYTTSASPAQGPDGFEKVFAADFVLGKGLGGVEVGMTEPEMLAKLGPTNAVTRTKLNSVYRFGPNLIELVVTVGPPGASSRVQSIRVNRFYRGSAAGIRIGDVFEKVKERMKPEAPIFEDRHAGALVYKSGSKFHFTDYNGGVLQGITAYDPSAK